MALLLEDHFTGTDNTDLASHAMDVGPGWTVNFGTFEINSNRARTMANSGNDCTCDAGVADYHAECTMQLDNGGENLGLIVRHNGANRYILCQNQAGTQQIKVMDYITNPVVTSQSITLAANTDYLFKVDCAGDDITFQIDDNTPLTAEVSYNNTETRVGLYGMLFSGTRHVRFEDFQVSDSTPPPDPPTALTLTQTKRLVGLPGDDSFPFTVQVSPAGSAPTANIYITPHVSPNATITPTSIHLHAGMVDDSATFIITPSRTGNHTVTITNDADLTNPVGLTYAVKTRDYLFQDGFESGDFSLWDGTFTQASGVAAVQGSVVKDGNFAAHFNCPNGNNDGSPPPDDRAFVYKQFTYPEENVLWMESDFRFVGEDTELNYGGGFMIEIGTNDTYNQRWNIEIYSPSQEFDDPSPYNGEYPISLEGTADAGTPRIHSNVHVWASPDTWYKLRMRIDYSGTNPSAEFFLEGVFVGTLVDTSVLSVNATPPTWPRVGCPWWDEAVKERIYMDNVAIYGEVTAVNDNDAAARRHRDPVLMWLLARH